MSKSSTNIVLVGSGTGGFLVYKELAAKLADRDIQLIVIDPRKFYVHLPSTLRMVVTPEGGLENKSIMDHPTDISSGNTRFVYGKVASIVDNQSRGGQVTLDDGETIDFSVLILATGSSWSGPIAFGNEKDEILQSVNSWRSRFKEAEDIVLVGGGAVGLGKHYLPVRSSIVFLNLPGHHRIVWRNQGCLARESLVILSDIASCNIRLGQEGYDCS